MLKKLFAGAGLLVVGAPSAFAAVPVAVTTAVTDMNADAASVATLVLVGIVGVAAIKFIRRGL